MLYNKKNLKLKAVILGGTHDHIHLINSVKELGYYVYLIDYLDNPIAKNYADEHIKISTTDISGVLSFCKNINCKLILSICVDSSLATATIVAEKLALPKLINIELIHKLKDKYLMKEQMIQNDILTPFCLTINEGDSMHNIIINSPKVIKPVDSSSSKGVFRVNNKLELQQKIQLSFDESRSKKCIIEDYIQGDEFSVDYFIENGEAKLLCVSKNIKGFDNDAFVITSGYYDPKFIDLFAKKLIKIGNKISSMNRIKFGPLLAQFIESNGEFYLIEYSTRLGGGSKYKFIQNVCGLDAIDLTLRSLNGVKLNVTPEYSNEHQFIHYVYSYPTESLDFINIEYFNNSLACDVFVYKTVGTRIRSASSSADRIFGIITKSINFDELQSNKCKIAKIIDQMSLNSDNKYIYSL